MKLKILFAVMLIIYVIGMFYVATKPDVQGTGLAPYDKEIHAIEFFLFTLILLLTLFLFKTKDYYLLAMGIVLALTLASELIQLPIVNRSFSVMDMMADLSGGLVGMLFFMVIERWKLLKRLS